GRTGGDDRPCGLRLGKPACFETQETAAPFHGSEESELEEFDRQLFTDDGQEAQNRIAVLGQIGSEEIGQAVEIDLFGLEGVDELGQAAGEQYRLRGRA